MCVLRTAKLFSLEVLYGLLCSVFFIWLIDSLYSVYFKVVFHLLCSITVSMQFLNHQFCSLFFFCKRSTIFFLFVIVTETSCVLMFVLLMTFI